MFRECLEASVIVSMLLSFIKQTIGNSKVEHPTLYKRLIRKIWLGVALGVLVSSIVFGCIVGIFYSLGKNIWSSSEELWEGIFSLIAAVIILFIGLAMLRINRIKNNWRLKIARAILRRENNHKISRYTNWTNQYALVLLPFITTLREVVEAFVFISGVSLGLPTTTFPLSIFCGLLAGLIVGYVLYKGSNMISMQYFLIVSTCFLYLIGAGLISRAAWYLERYNFSLKTGEEEEEGFSEQNRGNISYNVLQTVWHVNCCNPETHSGWEIFNALFGWQNSATKGSVIAYNVYWLIIIAVIHMLMYQERTGKIPIIDCFLKKKVISTNQEEQTVQMNEAIPNKKYTSLLKSLDEVSTQEMTNYSFPTRSDSQKFHRMSDNEI